MMRRRRLRIYRQILEEQASASSSSGSTRSETAQSPQLNPHWQTMLHDKRIPLAQRQALAQKANKTVGNRQVQRAYDTTYATSMPEERMAATPGTASNFRSFYPMSITFDDETVIVHDRWEEQNAPVMIRELKEVYGIELYSFKGYTSITRTYSDASEEVLGAIKPADWEFKEIHALWRAAKHFTPILGANRVNSTRNNTPQEVLFAGKVNASIKDNQVSNHILGQFFDDYDLLNLTGTGTNSRIDFEFNTQQLEGTAIHELAHGLMDYALADFVEEMAYWSDEKTPSGEEGAEAPVTLYGRTNAGEDLAEAMMFFFMQPKTLASKCPARYKFLMIRMLEWTNAGKQIIELGQFMKTNLPAVIKVMQQFAGGWWD